MGSFIDGPVGIHDRKKSDRHNKVPTGFRKGEPVGGIIWEGKLNSQQQKVNFTHPQLPPLKHC